jgi:hypothetical protein
VDLKKLDDKDERWKNLLIICVHCWVSVLAVLYLLVLYRQSYFVVVLLVI